MVSPAFFFAHASLISANALSNTGYETMVQLGTHISQKHHSTHNCTQIRPPWQVITNSCTPQYPSHSADKRIYSFVVTYPGFPFPPYTSLYPPSDHVQAYHHSYAAHFELYPYIRFNHSLESAYWVGNASNGFWELSISTDGPREEIVPLNKPPAHNLRYNSPITRRFDHLVVAVGRNHYPRFLAWAAGAAANEWLGNGKGRRVMHSIYFREPEEFAGKVILVVGAGGSGADFVIRCSGHAKRVCLHIHHPCSW